MVAYKYMNHAKKICFLAVLAAIIMPCAANAAGEPPENTAVSTILYEANTGSVLYENNADEMRPIASITKIMTALIVLEHGNLDETLTMRSDWTAVEGSSSNFKAGESCTVRQLLYALMLASGNDAAEALACYTAGSTEAFADLMNAKARQLEMNGSSFRNPHGLDEEGHYSTARDMAVLTSEAMKNKEFVTIVSTKQANAGGRFFVNHNKLLWDYPGTIGVKTGYTSASGRTLVSCNEKNGMKLICVTLSDGNDWQDHMNLYNWAGDNLRYENVAQAGKTVCTVPVVSGVVKETALSPVCDLNILVRSGDELEVVYSVPRFVYAGVSAGEKAGEVQVYVNGDLKCSTALIFNEAAELDESVPLTAWEKIKWALRIASEYPSYNPGLYL